MEVSKYISSVTYRRSVWIDALRRLSIQHDIYAPSFPLTEMALAELEHAATTCRRFSARLRSEFLQHHAMRPASIQYINPTQPGEEFDHLRILSGGRFLLTTLGRTLRLWDLGKLPNNTEFHPIGSIELDGVTKIQTVRTRACKSSSEVLVIVTTTELRRWVHRRRMAIFY